jgi:hypothetical protein
MLQNVQGHLQQNMNLVTMLNNLVDLLIPGSFGAPAGVVTDLRPSRNKAILGGDGVVNFGNISLLRETLAVPELPEESTKLVIETLRCVCGPDAAAQSLSQEREHLASTDLIAVI